MTEDASQNRDSIYRILHRLNVFFKSPIVLFFFSFLSIIFTIWFTEKEMQVFAVGSLFAVYLALAAIYIFFHEKVSARGLRDENERLKAEVKKLTAEKAFLFDKLDKTSRDLESQVPQVIWHKEIVKKINIHDEEGTGAITMTFDGRNVSGRPIWKVRHRLYTSNRLSKEDVLSTTFNDENVKPRVEPTRIGEGWRANIIIEASEPCEKNERIKTSYSANMTKEYAEAFVCGKKATSYHTPAFRTDLYRVEISAPKGFYFFSNPSVDVRDVFNDITIFDEIDRVMKKCFPRLKEERTKIVWELSSPRLSYQYILAFNLRKR